MGITLKKNIVYDVFIILALLFMCMGGGLVVDRGVLYSVLDVIRGLAGERSVDAGTAFGVGVTYWMYILLPVASVPFMAFLAEERKSGYHLFEKQRRGTIRYLCKTMAFAFASSALILFVVIAVYAAVVYGYFGITVPDGGMLFVSQVLGKYVYVQMYSFSLSCMGALLVYMYNDLYVDVSIVMLLNYIFKEILIKDQLVCPVAVCVLSVVLYVAVRKMRCDKI